MSDKPLIQRLQIKPGRTVRIVNAPSGYDAVLGALPAESPQLNDETTAADVTQVFVRSQQDLEAQLPALQPLIKPQGLLWICWPKGTSKLAGDINRDTIAAYAQTLGLQPVASVAIDTDWSALRFKVIG